MSTRTCAAITCLCLVFYPPDYSRRVIQARSARERLPGERAGWRDSHAQGASERVTSNALPYTPTRRLSHALTTRRTPSFSMQPLARGSLGRRSAAEEEVVSRLDEGIPLRQSSAGRRGDSPRQRCREARADIEVARIFTIFCFYGKLVKVT